MNPELRNRALMVALLLVAWAGLVYLKTILNASVLPDLNAIIAQVQVLMGGVVGYHVGTGAGPVSVPPIVLPAAAPSGQGGFVSLRLLVAIAGLALGLSLLAGCAGFQQAVTGYESAAYAGIKASDDNTISVWKAVACGTPLSAALRNPDIIPALTALCLPGGNASNPANLLDAGRVPITINLTVPAAAASAPK